MSNFYLGKAGGWAKIIVGGIEDTTLKLLANLYKYLVTTFTSWLSSTQPSKEKFKTAKLAVYVSQYGELIDNPNILILSKSTCFTKALV